MDLHQYGKTLVTSIPAPPGSKAAGQRHGDGRIRVRHQAWKVEIPIVGLLVMLYNRGQVSQSL